MKKLILLACVLVMMLLAGTTFAALTADMVAGNPPDDSTVVGTVTVETIGDQIVVTYHITEAGWVIQTTHLCIWDPAVDEDPKIAGGGPPPGLFPWSTPFSMDDETVVYKIDIIGNYPGKGKKAGDPYDWTGDTVNVAAHAVVGYGNCDEGGLSGLPEQVYFKAIYADPLANPPETHYFPTVQIPALCPDETPVPTIIDGIYGGWCLDPHTALTSDRRRLAYVYPSNGILPLSLTGLWQTPENLPMVIWLLNQDYVGQQSSCDGLFTYGDVQNAMWALLEDGDLFGGYVLGPWDECRVGEILAEAYLHYDYEPGCGDYLGIILDTRYNGDCTTPRPERQDQPVLIPFLCGCGDETAWAGVHGTDDDPVVGDPDGENDDDDYIFEFPGSDWAMYVMYTVGQ